MSGAAAVQSLVTEGDPEREATLGQQAGIVTAANAAVSGHGDGGAHAALPGVLGRRAGRRAGHRPERRRRSSTRTRGGRAGRQRRGCRSTSTRGAPRPGSPTSAAAPLASSSGPLSRSPRAGRSPARRSAVAAARARSRARADDAGRRRPAAVGDRLPAVAGRQRPAARARRVPAARRRSSARRTRTPTCRRCASGRSSPPTSRSPSPTRGSRTTRWCGSTRRSPGSPATRYDEAVGRNCRFLQGPATDPRAVAEIRGALAEQRTGHRRRC